MSKRFLITIIFVLSAFIFISCGGAKQEYSIVGKWMIIESGGNPVPEEESKEVVFNFEKSVIKIEEKGSVVEKYAYTIEKKNEINQIHITGSMGDNVYGAYTFSENGSIMILKTANPDKGEVYPTNFEQEDGFFIEKFKKL